MRLTRLEGTSIFFLSISDISNSLDLQAQLQLSLVFQDSFHEALDSTERLHAGLSSARYRESGRWREDARATTVEASPGFFDKETELTVNQTDPNLERKPQLRHLQPCNRRLG